MHCVSPVYEHKGSPGKGRMFLFSVDRSSPKKSYALLFAHKM